MRLLMLSWEYPPYVVGGLGAHVAALVPALARQGVHVTLVTPRWKGGAYEERLDSRAVVHRVDTPVATMGNFYADAQQTNLNLEEVGHSLWAPPDGATPDAAGQSGEFDLIHAHDWLVAFAAASLKRLHKTPLVATIHATERGRGRGHLSGEMSNAINGTEWWLAYEAWRIITASGYMADEVKNYFQVPNDKIDVIPNGVDTARFDARDGLDLAQFRTRWALPWEKIIFNVGRVVYEKGAHLLVEAAPRVLALEPDAKFIIAGTGGMVEDLRRRVVELGLGSKVLVTGFVSDEDRDRLFKIADVAVFPSLYEPFGIVALEAMAAKCPVIVSEVGGLKEVVQHGETGITVYPGSLDSLVWGILHTLQHPDWAAARVANAYRVVREEFNWNRIAARTIQVYERVIRERAEKEWV
jgi:glycosyltransferase involved in cell wall biosynthesis